MISLDLRKNPQVEGKREIISLSEAIRIISGSTYGPAPMCHLTGINPRPCEYCGKIFVPLNSVHKYCTASCSYEASQKRRQEKRWAKAMTGTAHYV